MIGNQIAGFFSVGAPPIPPTNYESIATVTVGSGGSSTITFSSIPSTYKHLQVRILANASSTAQAIMSFNGDTSSSNYSFHSLVGNNSGAQSQGYATGTLGGVVPSPRLGGGSYFGNAIVDILDYTNTNKYKTTRELLGWDGNGTGEVQLTSGGWYSGSAINSISFVIQGGGDFVEHSKFALYGISGA